MRVLIVLALNLQLFLISCSIPSYELGVITGTLINGTGSEPFEDRLIIIQDGVIVDIVNKADQSKYKFNAIVDATNKYLIPGLFDMHSHLTMTNRVQDTLNNKIQAWVPYDRKTAEWTLKTLLRYGIVTVRETGGFTEAILNLKVAVEQSQITGPDIFTCGPLIESGTPFFSNMSSIVNTEEEAVREVFKQVESGVDFIKFYASVPPELAKVIIAEAHKNNKRVLGHLGSTTWSQAIEFGIDGIVHTPNSDVIRNSALGLTKMMSEKRIANDPTLYVSKSILLQDTVPDEILDMLPTRTKESWEQESGVFRTKIIPNINMEELFKNKVNYVNTAYKSGVTILVGSDFNNSNTFPGYSLHKELQELAQCGIPNDTLIRLATHDAAKWLGISEVQGTIEKGKRADLIILNKDPIKDIANTLEIDNVVFKGKLLSRDLRQMK